MANGMLLLIRMTVVLMVFALAILGIMYVLELFGSEVAQAAALKVMAVLGIICGASLVGLFAAAAGTGSRRDDSSPTAPPIPPSSTDSSTKPQA
jgi:hypothetical protein